MKLYRSLSNIRLTHDPWSDIRCISIFMDLTRATITNPNLKSPSLVSSFDKHSVYLWSPFMNPPMWLWLLIVPINEVQCGRFRTSNCVVTRSYPVTSGFNDIVQTSQTSVYSMCEMISSSLDFRPSTTPRTYQISSSHYSDVTARDHWDHDSMIHSH